MNTASTWSRTAKRIPTIVRRNGAAAMGLPGKRKKRRGENVEGNLTQFEEMKADTEERQRWCMGAKLSVHSHNRALRISKIPLDGQRRV